MNRHRALARRALLAAVTFVALATGAHAQRSVYLQTGGADVTIVGESGRMGVQLVATDLDADTVADLLVSTQRGPVRSFRPGRTWPETWDLADRPPTAVIASGDPSQSLLVAGVGDIDADGWPDVAVIAPWADRAGGTQQNVGQVHVYLEAVTLPVGVPTWRLPDVWFFGTPERRIVGACVADLESDGLDDIVVTVTTLSSVEFWIFRGRLAWPDTIDLAIDVADSTVTSLPLTTPALAGVADVTGDGLVDLLVAASPPWVLPGRASWPPVLDGSTEPVVVLPVGTTTGTIAVLAGDLDGDAPQDVLVTDRDVFSAGRVRVFRGGPDLATAPPVSTVLGRDSGDRLRAQAVADVDGDGVADIVLTAEGATGPRNGGTDAGEAVVLRGPLPAGTLDLSEGHPELTVYGPWTGSGLVGGVAQAVTGDFDGDGRADLAVSAPSWDRASNSLDTGAVFMVFAPDLVSPAPPPREVFVDATRGSDTNDGASWQTARRTLTPVFYETWTTAEPVTVHVAEGTYPGEVFMGQGFTLLGGYPPGGGVRNPWAHPTRIVPRRGYPALRMYASRGVQASVLDGFVLTGARAFCAGLDISGGTQLVANTQIVDNSACVAAVCVGHGFIEPDSHVRLVNCVIGGTTANVFAGCSEAQGDGLVALAGVEATHLTVAHNAGVGVRLGQRLEPSFHVVERSIVALNGGDDIVVDDASSVVRTSLVGASSSALDSSVIFGDPLFLGNRDLRLSQLAAGEMAQSPAVDAGDVAAADDCLASPGLPPCLDAFTTRTDDAWDGGAVDLGFHWLVPPNQPPVFAGAAVAEPAGDCALVVRWSAATDPEAQRVTYAVYRAASPGAQDFSSPHALTPSQSFTEPVAWGVTWHYVVRARDTRGGEDGNTVEVSATAVDARPPAATLTATDAGGCDVLLTFDATDECSGGARAVELHRSSDSRFTPDASTLVASTPVSPWSDVVPQSGFWHYRVRAADAAGNVVTSGVATVRVATCAGDVPPPGEPRLRVRVQAGALIVDLDAAAGAVTHRLYRGTLAALRAGSHDHEASVGADRTPDTADDVGRCRMDGTSATDPGGLAAGAFYWLATGLDAAGREGSVGTDSFGSPRPAGAADCP